MKKCFILLTYLALSIFLASCERGTVKVNVDQFEFHLVGYYGDVGISKEAVVSGGKCQLYWCGELTGECTVPSEIVDAVIDGIEAGDTGRARTVRYKDGNGEVSIPSFKIQKNMPYKPNRKGDDLYYMVYDPLISIYTYPECTSPLFGYLEDEFGWCTGEYERQMMSGGGGGSGLN